MLLSERKDNNMQCPLTLSQKRKNSLNFCQAKAEAQRPLPLVILILQSFQNNIYIYVLNVGDLLTTLKFGLGPEDTVGSTVLCRG